MKRLALLCTVAMLIPACGDDLSGPPTIRLGRDQCAGCGMIINEDKSSCALLVEQEGARAYLLFDDPGCMLDHRADHREIAVVDSFVHDYGTTSWVAGAGASYLTGVTDTLSTPMGSGIVAFESAARAAEQQKSSGGEVVRYEQLPGVRRAWREARH
jgi:nitrous oxide reductase accessory protein NosL